MRLLSLALSVICLCLFSLRAYGQTEEELIAGAKKEAKVTFWSGMALDDSRLVAAGFEKKYPFIKVDIFRAGGEQIVNRAIAEAGVGQNSADVLNAFALKVLQERGFLQPYAAPEAAAYPAAYKDPKNFWVSMKNNYNVIGYNSRLVGAQEAPKIGRTCCIPAGKTSSEWMTKSTFGTQVCSSTGVKPRVKNTWKLSPSRGFNGATATICSWN